MKTIKSILSIAFFLLISVTAVAQNNKGIERAKQKVSEKYEKMFIDLKLSDDQKQAVINNWAERNEEIRHKAEKAEDPKAVRAEINKEYHEKLKEEVGAEVLQRIRQWQKQNSGK